MDNALAIKTEINMDDFRALVVSQNTVQPTDHEMYVFKRLCESLGANPFLKDIHIVKYTASSPASFITGKDYFTKVARSQGATWEAGILVIRNGEVVKQVGSFSLPTDEIVGGWADVHTSEGKVMPMQISLDEYDNKQSTWSKLKKTMIRKVALVQALREAYPEKLGGVYDSTEMQQASQFEDVDLVDTIENMDKGLPKAKVVSSPMVEHAESLGATVVESKPKPTNVVKEPVTLEDYPNVVLHNTAPAPAPQVMAPPAGAIATEPPDSFNCPIHNKEFAKRDGKYGAYWSHVEQNNPITNNNFCNVNANNFKPDFAQAWIRQIAEIHGQSDADAIALDSNGKGVTWWLDKVENGMALEKCFVVECQARAEIEVQGTPTCLAHESEING